MSICTLKSLIFSLPFSPQLLSFALKLFEQLYLPSLRQHNQTSKAGTTKISI